jgi:hypothetical protein
MCGKSLNPTYKMVMTGGWFIIVLATLGCLWLFEIVLNRLLIIDEYVLDLAFQRLWNKENEAQPI